MDRRYVVKSVPGSTVLFFQKFYFGACAHVFLQKGAKCKNINVFTVIPVEPYITDF